MKAASKPAPQAKCMFVSRQKSGGHKRDGTALDSEADARKRRAGSLDEVATTTEAISSESDLEPPSPQASAFDKADATTGRADSPENVATATDAVESGSSCAAPSALDVTFDKDCCTIVEGLDCLLGHYAPSGLKSHGKSIFRRVMGEDGALPVGSKRTFLYYWSAEDGEEQEGWWFGDSVGGDLVWCHARTAAGAAPLPGPPERGWHVPVDGEPPIVGLRVRAVQPRPHSDGAARSREGSLGRSHRQAHVDALTEAERSAADLPAAAEPQSSQPSASVPSRPMPRRPPAEPATKQSEKTPPPKASPPTSSPHSSWWPPFGAKPADSSWQKPADTTWHKSTDSSWQQPADTSWEKSADSWQQTAGWSWRKPPESSWHKSAESSWWKHTDPSWKADAWSTWQKDVQSSWQSSGEAVKASALDWRHSGVWSVADEGHAKNGNGTSACEEAPWELERRRRAEAAPQARESDADTAVTPRPKWHVRRFGSKSSSQPPPEIAEKRPRTPPRRRPPASAAQERRLPPAEASDTTPWRARDDDVTAIDHDDFVFEGVDDEQWDEDDYVTEKEDEPNDMVERLLGTWQGEISGKRTQWHEIERKGGQSGTLRCRTWTRTPGGQEARSTRIRVVETADGEGGVCVLWGRGEVLLDVGASSSSSLVWCDEAKGKRWQWTKGWSS